MNWDINDLMSQKLRWQFYQNCYLLHYFGLIMHLSFNFQLWVWTGWTGRYGNKLYTFRIRQKDENPKDLHDWPLLQLPCRCIKTWLVWVQDYTFTGGGTVYICMSPSSFYIYLGIFECTKCPISHWQLCRHSGENPFELDVSMSDHKNEYIHHFFHFGLHKSYSIHF